MPLSECPDLHASHQQQAASLASEAFGIQECFNMISRAEKRRDLSYTHIVSVRPDYLWSSPLPPVDQWSRKQVMHPRQGSKSFVIVPKSAFSCLRVYDFLGSGCFGINDVALSSIGRQASKDAASHGLPLAPNGSSSGIVDSNGGRVDHDDDTRARSQRPETLRCNASLDVICLLRIGLETHGIGSVLLHQYANGAPMRAPPVGNVCGPLSDNSEELALRMMIRPQMEALCL